MIGLKEGSADMRGLLSVSLGIGSAEEDCGGLVSMVMVSREVSQPVRAVTAVGAAVPQVPVLGCRGVELPM
jgi:hypothetical protein